MAYWTFLQFNMEQESLADCYLTTTTYSYQKQSGRLEDVLSFKKKLPHPANSMSSYVCSFYTNCARKSRLIRFCKEFKT